MTGSETDCSERKRDFTPSIIHHSSLIHSFSGSSFYLFHCVPFMCLFCKHLPCFCSSMKRHRRFRRAGRTQFIEVRGTIVQFRPANWLSVDSNTPKRTHWRTSTNMSAPMSPEWVHMRWKGFHSKISRFGHFDPDRWKILSTMCPSEWHGSWWCYYQGRAFELSSEDEDLDKENWHPNEERPQPALVSSPRPQKVRTIRTKLLHEWSQTCPWHDLDEGHCGFGSKVSA